MTKSPMTETTPTATMSAAEIAALPYRPCVGITLFNQEGKVFVAQRIDNPGPAWQMPQGGGDEGELGGGGGTAGKPPRSSGLASRADAVRILQQVATFLREAEPSSPAPMFIDKELMPDSRDRIEMLGGISLEDPDSDSD